MLTPETRLFITQHALDDVHKLRLKAAPQGVDMLMAVQQIEGRQRATKKLPGWAALPDLLFPPRLSMEQCSSELTARYKVELAKRLMPSERKRLTDLTGGYGVDFCHLAAEFRQATYVEQREELCHIVSHNVQVLGLTQCRVVQAEATAHAADMEKADMIFIDPARRDNSGKKTVLIADCEPDVTALQQLLREKSCLTLIKLSPMLDIRQALRDMKGITEVHVVSAEGECKELLLVMQAECATAPTYHAVNLHTDGTKESFVFKGEEETQAVCTYANTPETYLYEPNASMLKAGAYRLPTVRFRLKKLHPNSHLYTSSIRIENFPGRTFRIQQVYGFGKKDIKQLQREVQQANLTVRNFPCSVAELRKKLHVSEGGDTYLFATTLQGEKHVLLRCSKEDSSTNTP